MTVFPGNAMLYCFHLIFYLLMPNIMATCKMSSEIRYEFLNQQSENSSHPLLRPATRTLVLVTMIAQKINEKSPLDCLSWNLVNSHFPLFFLVKAATGPNPKSHTGHYLFYKDGLPKDMCQLWSSKDWQGRQKWGAALRWRGIKRIIQKRWSLIKLNENNVQ